jgi:hypothetical protein
MLGCRCDLGNNAISFRISRSALTQISRRRRYGQDTLYSLYGRNMPHPTYVEWTPTVEVNMIDIAQLRALYVQLNGSRPADQQFIDRITKELEITLPHDFVAGSEFFDGSGVAVLALHPISPSIATNILSETIRLRISINLPKQFLVLGEPPGSLLTLNCVTGEVVWCDASEVTNLREFERVRSPQIWGTYREFLYSVLQDEKNDRE